MKVKILLHVLMVVAVVCMAGGAWAAEKPAGKDKKAKRPPVAAKPVPPPGEKPTIAVDAAKTGEPISKYVYGQFIEHLGRCIYGGIWAEMLQDRKFFYPVGAKESPWKVIGDASAVKMDQERGFGEQTPRIALPGGRVGGIAQDGIGLLAGKEYAGRIWLNGPGDIGPVEVSLIWGDGPDDRQTIKVTKLVTGVFAKTGLKFMAGAAVENARLEITAKGKGDLCIGTVSLMPADNIQGMRADTLACLKELDSPVYRWPGGNFVSGYNWKDGIGDRDKRPPRKNPAWQGIEHNDFGLDEFIAYCRYLKTDPYIAVNSGLGDTKSAVEEVEYANGAADTPMGKLRAQNGHPEPYGVKFWSIGNEMYGGWQLGHMPLEKYTQKHNGFADAMRKVDPTIKLIAVGATGKWSETMLRDCAGHMDLISEHFYCQQKPGLWEHVRQIPDAVRHKAEAQRKYDRAIESLKGKDIRIALDEWNYWYGPHVFGELGTRYFLRDGLGIAAGLNEMARQSDVIYMANYAQTVNVIGAIKTTKTAAALETTGVVLKLYRAHFGTLPAETRHTGAIDAQAAWTADRKTLTLAVVNVSTEAVEVPLTIKGAKLTGYGTRSWIAGNDPMLYNEPGKPLAVDIQSERVEGNMEKLSLPPCSASVFSLRAEPTP